MNANENLVPTESKLHIGGTAPVGSCAIRPTYSDGHAGGHYSWDDRNDLGDNALWKRYLERLQAAGASRDRRDHPRPLLRAARLRRRVLNFAR